MKSLISSVAIVISLVCIQGCNNINNDHFFDDGVSYQLAQWRAKTISNVNYTLSFSIPDNISEPINAEETIEFDLASKDKPVLLDFRTPAGYLKFLSVNGKELTTAVKDNHIVLPVKFLSDSRNKITLAFRTGDQSLNRNEEYLYTLFVPDRACTAFPCFDQPDLKAYFNLTLEIPSSYEAIANNPVIRLDSSAGRRLITFDRGEKLPTYLFAFAAGKFQRIEKEIDGVKMEMLHRETRKEYVERNADEIFRLHYKAIRWMEEYTGIRYPFPKFGFVVIPTFQYSGMEHPGSICYKASSLFLDDSPTLNEQLTRASLISHETSHIWFGDLVTMKWFNDVWLKEVFAGFFADKIVSPDFPTIDNDLRFLLSHYPAAYAVDRTQGSNPVIQQLDNMKDAGSLYGNIIYHKAPVVMKHLEQITGEDGLRNSLKNYLKKFSYSNAEWSDLVNVIGESTGKQLKEWSDAWVREAGMPTIEPEIKKSKTGYKIRFRETDPAGRGRHWPQTLKTKVITTDGAISSELYPGDTTSVLSLSNEPVCIIPDTTGISYGCFVTDNGSLNYLKEKIGSISDPLIRGTIWINLNEQMLNGKLQPEVLWQMMFNAIHSENDLQLQTWLSGRLSYIFLNKFDDSERGHYGKLLEDFSWERVSDKSVGSQRRTWFALFRNIALSEEALSRLYKVWETGSLPCDVKLSEDDLCTVAFTLSLKDYPDAGSLMKQQYNNITNPDRKKKFAFISPSVSGDEAVRDAFFESLKKEENRSQEPWVIEALGYLHSPLRQKSSEKYILPSLELLEEIKATGDIFFPASWITTTLEGHHSENARQVVTSFLKTHPGYPENLRLKILQAADQLIR
ncbi:MAG TPA: M1 family aminopeptidase [Bacteroidales bacterium]|nr:M1 family aminopeptidase [Bacteroidales bacterium]